MRCILVTGSSDLIGSEVAAHFLTTGWQVVGGDNNQRDRFFESLDDIFDEIVEASTESPTS